MTTRESFQKSFRECYEQSGRTQEEVAKAAGVSRSTVSCWLRGKSFPRADAMEKVAAFLGVTPTDLIGYDSRDRETILLNLFRRLPDIGKDKLIDRAEELIKLYGEKTEDNPISEVI